MNCIQGAKCVCYSINTSIPNTITWNNSPFSFTEYIGEVWGRKAYRLSAPDCPPCLALYENGGFCQVCETGLRPIQSGVYSSLLRWNVMKSKDQNGCEMILYEPSNEKSDSLIVLLHGGPHNCFAACYTPDILFYVHQRYTVLVPNYHGSFGAGDAFLHSLCGHIGDIEIHDVLDSIETALRERPSLSHDSLYLMGSSYGGFIGMKLLQARPTLFRVVEWIVFVVVCDSAEWSI